MAKITTVNMCKLTKDMTMTVKLNGACEFKIRLFIARKLITLAAFVIGCNINIVKDKENG